MANIGKVKLFAVIALSVCIVGVLTVSAYGLLDKPEISPAQAVDRVKSFVKVDKIDKIEKDELPMKQQVYEVTAADGRIFWVDTKSGDIVGVVGAVDAAPVDPTELPLTKDAAVKRAESFVKTKYKNFDELAITKITDMPDGSYLINWAKIAPSGAKLLRTVSIAVDPKTGNLGLYSAKDEGTLISSEPKISKDEAERIVKSKLTSRASLVRLDLNVFNNRDGMQRLVWCAIYDDISETPLGEMKVSDTVYIDATTGKNISEEFSVSASPSDNK